MISFLLELTKRDFSERFAGSALGAVWAFIWPAVQLFVYIVIFGKLIGGKLPGKDQTFAYGIYVASGLIPWTSFQNVIIRSSGIFLEKRHIISKVKVSLHSFPIFIVLSESILFLFSFLILTAFLKLSGQSFSLKKFLLIPFIYYLQQILAFSLGLLFATFTVFLRDLKQAVDIGLQLWFWFTPVVYPESILPLWLKNMIRLNPMYTFVDTYHRIVFSEEISLLPLFFLNLICHILLFFAVFFLKTFEKELRDFL